MKQVVCTWKSIQVSDVPSSLLEKGTVLAKVDRRIKSLMKVNSKVPYIQNQSLKNQNHIIWDGEFS